MRTGRLSEMKGGWFVGGFWPTMFETTNCEVAVKTYKAGDYEPKHYHKLATELTVIIDGIVEMNGVSYKKGDIIVIEPGEATNFRAVTDSTNAVVKIPGALNDKFIEENENA